MLGEADHRSPGWVAEAARIEEVGEAAGSFAGIRLRLDAVLIPEAWDENVLAERQAGARGTGTSGGELPVRERFALRAGGSKDSAAGRCPAPPGS